MEIPYTVENRAETGLYNGKLGMWLFLGTEIMFFTAFIGVYLVLRLGSIDATGKIAWPTDPKDTHLLVWAGGLNFLDLHRRC